MAFTADVGDDLETVGQAHLGDLTQCGVRFFRRRGVDAGTDTALLRARVERGDLALGLFYLARLANELIDCRHA